MPNNTNDTNGGRSLDQAVQAGIDAANAIDADARSESDKGYDEAVRTPWNGSEQSDRPQQRQGEQDGEDAQSLSGGGRPSDPTGVETAAGNQQSSS